MLGLMAGLCLDRRLIRCLPRPAARRNGRRPGDLWELRNVRRAFPLPRALASGALSATGARFQSFGKPMAGGGPMAAVWTAKLERAPGRLAAGPLQSETNG